MQVAEIRGQLKTWHWTSVMTLVTKNSYGLIVIILLCLFCFVTKQAGLVEEISGMWENPLLEAVMQIE